MADYEGSLPIKTVRDNDAAVKLVDGASGTAATRKLTVAMVGDAVTASTNDYGVPVLTKDSAGNYTLINVGDQGGVKVQVFDTDGNELNFVGDGEAVATQKGVIALGTDGTNLQFISTDSSGRLQVELATAQGVDGATAPAETVQVGGKDAAGNLQTLNVNTDGSVNAVIVEGGTEICDYQTSAAVAKDASVNHDYVVTNTKNWDNGRILVGARGAVKVRVGTYDGSTFTPKFTWFQQIQNNQTVDIQSLRLTGDGTAAIRIEITNLDQQASDVYSTLQGVEK